MAANFQDDDDFDWEAAVAEIDEACRRAGRASASTSFPGPSSENHGRLYARPSQVTLSQNSFRQRTLDGYLRPQEVRQATRPACHNLGNPEEQDSGIDPVAAATWIYPANVTKREYQFKISQAALFSNTIVSLPTGLGKTLIAAVVMYNYFRWFPRGKVIFTAPSRPLVSQQIEACHNIMGIPQAMTIEMTGHMTPQSRAEFWQTKRVFYVTPQVLEKDIQAGTCPKQLIVCLVVDEAHRATGNYSYCVVVRELIAADVKLRILALTATPGSNQASIQAVVDNLQISLLEHRSDNDPDVRQYIHDRKVEVIQVALSREGNRVKDMLLQVMQPVVKRLTALGVFFTRDYTMNSSYDFHAARNKYRESPPTTGAAAKKEAEDSFALAVTLYNIYKLVHCHGITCAVVMLERKLNEPGIFSRLMLRNQKLLEVKRIMQDCVRHGAPSPKLNKLEEILQDHFRVHNPRETRAIIFTSFRESVKDIMNALTKQDGDVKAMEFVGQSSGARDSYGKTQKGQTQKVQQAVLQKFRAGGYNTLVATSIGEEGLDIMEVDLVVCFDANVSPLRMIQRMGRTGRKRDGRVVVLASEGAELQSYQSKLAKNKALVKHMQDGGLQSFNFHLSPRMVPHRYKPQVQETEMLIEKFVPRSYKQKASAEIEDPDADLTAEECAVLQKYSNSSIANMWNPSLIAFPRFQLVPTPVYRVKHSFRTTSMLIGTLQSLESSSQQLCNREKSRDFSPSDVEIEDLNWDKDAIAWTEDENMGRHWSLEDEQCEPVLFMTPRVLENPVLEVPEIVDPSLVSAEGSQVGIPWSRKESPVLVSCHPSKSERPSPNIGQEDNTSAHMNSSFETRANAEDVRLQSEHILDDRLANKQYLHRCLFSKGFVSVSPTGSIVIASPPTLRDKASDNYLDKVEVSTFRVWPFNSAVTYQMVSSDTDQSSKAGGAVKIVNTGSTSGRLGDGDSIAKSPGDQLMTALPVTGSEQALCPRSGKMGFNSDCKANNYDIIVPSSLRKTAVVHVDPERGVRALDQHIVNFQHRKDVSSAGVSLEDVNFVPASISPKQTGCTRTALAGSSYMGAKVPAAGFFQDKLVECSHTPGRLATSRAFPNDLSPRLTNLAEQGMVPVSPLPETPVMQKHVTFQNQYSQQDVPKEEAWDSGQELQVQCTRMTSSGTRRGLPPSGPVICRGRPPLRSPVQVVEAGGTSPIQPKSLQFNHASPAPLTTTEFQRSPLCMGTTGSIQTASWAKKTTPNIPQASHSNEGVEIPTSVAMSVQKPRKFKRLRKVRQVSSPELAEAGMGTLSIQEEAGQPRNHTTAGVSRRGEDTSKGKAVVRPFVDDEAEASSDDACSSDEEDGTEDGEDLTDFIDDATNPSSAPTQNPPIASVDMMAVYRRSLFTPSPAHGAGVAPWMRFAQSGHTPSSDATGASGSSLDTGSCPATAATDRTRVTADSAQKSDPPDTVIETPTFNAISMAKVPPSVGSTYSSKQMPVAQADALSLSVPLPLVEGTADGAKGRLEIRKRKLSFQPDLSEPEAPAGVNQSGQTQQPEQQFQIAYLEDDFFDGLDLDALEAQAVQQSRARQATQQQQQAAFPKHHSLDRHP